MVLVLMTMEEPEKESPMKSSSSSHTLNSKFEKSPVMMKMFLGLALVCLSLVRMFVLYFGAAGVMESYL